MLQVAIVQTVCMKMQVVITKLRKRHKNIPMLFTGPKIRYLTEKSDGKDSNK